MEVKRDKVLRDAEKLVQKGKYEQAIKEYEKVLRRFPNDTNIINRVGDLYGQIGQLQRAIELYEEIADHFTADGFTTKAIAILKKIQRLDPQRLDIFERLADLYFDQGLLVEAKREYQILADWYTKNGQLEKAIESHEKLVNLDPSNHISALRLADLLHRRGEINSALNVYQRLGTLLLEKGKLDEAERLYRHVIEQDPQEGEFLVDVCTQFLEAGRTSVVLEFLTFGVDRSPESVELKALLVRTHLGMGEAKKALEMAREILATDSTNIEIRTLVGGALISTGEAEEAKEMLLPVAAAHLDKSHHVRAQEAVKDLVKALPDDQEVLRMAVRAYAPSGDDDTLFTLTAALAENYYQSGELKGAKRLFLRLQEKDPSNQQFRQRLSELSDVSTGDHGADVPVDDVPDEIVVDDDKTVDLTAEEVEKPRGETEGGEVVPDDFDLDERLAEAAVFAKYGLVEKAINHLEDVVLFCPDEIEPRQRLALLDAENGDQDAAVSIAGPVVEHHRAQGSMDAISDLVNALPQLAEGPAESVAAEAPVDAEAPAKAPEGIAATPAVAEEPTAVEFVDEESDLIEIVDIEGDLAAPPSAEEPAPVVEEFAVDFGTDLGSADAVAEPPEAEEPAAAEAAAEPPVVEPVVPPPPAEEIQVEVQPPPPVVAPEEREVADELVEITDSFVGPSMGDLEQLDFFLDQELYEDAARVLSKLEEEHGEDPEVVERRLKLKEVGVLLEQVETVEEGAEELFADEEQYIDLAKELEAELAAEEAMVEEATGRGKGEAILEEVFKEFQKGVAEQLSEEDSDTHFNLGIAYREMGLLPEAIREFQVCLLYTSDAADEVVPV